MIFKIKKHRINKYISKDNEEWKRIKDYPDYEVSNLGNIRRIGSDSILKGRITNQGYLRVALYGGKALSKTHGRDIPIHRLVIETFNPRNNKALTVDHINSNKLDNDLYNLTYMTIKDNVRKANNKKVGVFDIKGNLIKVYESATIASKELNRSRTCICERIRLGTIVNGLIYKYI